MSYRAPPAVLPSLRDLDDLREGEPVWGGWPTVLGGGDNGATVRLAGGVANLPGLIADLVRVTGGEAVLAPGRPVHG